MDVKRIGSSTLVIIKRLGGNSHTAEKAASASVIPGLYDSHGRVLRFTDISPLVLLRQNALQVQVDITRY